MKMWRAVLAVWISWISIQSYEIWSLTNDSVSETNVSRQPPNYPKVSYDSSNFDGDAYREMIRSLRQLLVSGNFNNGIPVMRQEVTDANRYVLVEITESRRQTVTFAINVVDAYVIGYRVGNRRYFFTEAPANAADYVFTDATEILPRQSSNYNHLQNRPNTPARREITLGLRTLDAAVTTLFSDQQNARSLIIIIQMISEAARYWDIEWRVLRNDAFLPDDYMLDLTNNWGALSEQIQSSIATAFQRVVFINNQRVDNVNHFVIAGLFLMKFMCNNNRRQTTTSVSHLQPTKYLEDDDTCRVSVEPRTYIRGRNGLCADVDGYVYRDGTPIVLFTCRTADAGNQLWTLRDNGRIESHGKCLTASGPRAGSSVIIHECETAHSSLIHWEMSNSGTLTNRVSGLVLTANSGTISSRLTVENNNYGSFQAWKPTTSITDPAVSIHWNNNRCIYYNGWYGAYTEACRKGARQEWRLYPDSTIRPTNWLNGCLELASESGIATRFVYIQVGRCDRYPELHRWIINHLGNIQNLKTGAVVQVWPNNHAYIHAAYPSNSSNQIWTLQSA